MTTLNKKRMAKKIERQFTRALSYRSSRICKSAAKEVHTLHFVISLTENKNKLKAFRKSVALQQLDRLSWAKKQLAFDLVPHDKVN